MSKQMAQFSIPAVAHLSPETTYRLLIDRLFPQYEKVLYLDCDLVVNRDVAELYDTNLEGAVLGATIGMLREGVYRYIDKTLHLLPEQYFNAGVILINIPRFSKEGIGEKGLRMLSEQTYMTQDQDVLNLLCANSVKFIDKHWNIEWEQIVEEGKEIILDETHKGTLDYLDEPNIIHFTGPCKPWAHPENELSEYFWRYARETDFYEEILMKNMNSAGDTSDVFSMFLFPWEAVAPGSKIAIYGGGSVGRAFLRQVEKTEYCRAVAVCDKAPEKLKGLSCPVISREELPGYDCDAVLIAVRGAELADEIRSDCIAAGVPEDKLIWRDPVKKAR